jgi:hypothetical protein
MFIYILRICRNLGPGKHRIGCSQSAIGWITGPPMEELDACGKEDAWIGRGRTLS